MQRVYAQMGLPANVVSFFKHLTIWDTGRHGLKSGMREEKVSWYIDIVCGFLQWDSYSPVRFSLSEIPVCKLFQEKIQLNGTNRRKISQKETQLPYRLTENYWETHRLLKDVNRTIAQARNDTGTYYSVVKCTDIISERGKMVKGKDSRCFSRRWKPWIQIRMRYKYEI